MQSGCSARNLNAASASACCSGVTPIPLHDFRFESGVLKRCGKCVEVHLATDKDQIVFATSLIRSIHIRSRMTKHLTAQIAHAFTTASSPRLSVPILAVIHHKPLDVLRPKITLRLSLRIGWLTKSVQCSVHSSCDRNRAVLALGGLAINKHWL